jgi:hypothetical protein
MNEQDRKEFDFALAQLRHAYTQLMHGAVLDQPQFAMGLIGPQIVRLEKLRELCNG